MDIILFETRPTNSLLTYTHDYNTASVITEMIRVCVCSAKQQRLRSPVIFLYQASIMQVPSLSHPVSKAAHFLSIFSSIVLVYLLLEAIVQGSAEIIREAHSV